MTKPALWRHALAASLVLFLSHPLCSEPSLPTGLDSDGEKPGEPQLPSGLGGGGREPLADGDEPALPTGISPQDDGWGDDSWPEGGDLWAEGETTNAADSVFAGITAA